MAKEITVTPVNIFKTKEQLRRTVQEHYPNYPVNYFIAYDENTNGYFPVFIGIQAIQLGIHNFYNVVV